MVLVVMTNTGETIDDIVIDLKAGTDTDMSAEIDAGIAIVH